MVYFEKKILLWFRPIQEHSWTMISISIESLYMVDCCEKASRTDFSVWFLSGDTFISAYITKR